MHLNWEFHLPADTNAETATELLTALRARALEMPFEEVTRLIEQPSGPSIDHLEGVCGFVG